MDDPDYWGVVVTVLEMHMQSQMHMQFRIPKRGLTMAQPHGIACAIINAYAIQIAYAAA